MSRRSRQKESDALPVTFSCAETSAANPANSNPVFMIKILDILGSRRVYAKRRTKLFRNEEKTVQTVSKNEDCKDKTWGEV